MFIKDKFAEIVGIAVSDSYKNNGIGSALINRVKNMGDIIEITAQTDQDAIGFYLKNGFQAKKYVKHYADGVCIRYDCVLNW